MVLKTFSSKDLQEIWKMFKVTLFLLLLLHNHLDVRKN